MSYLIQCEYTDTFGGEANYSWVKRAVAAVPDKSSQREVSRAIKAALDLSGLSGRVYWDGDRWEFRPYGMCTVAFGHVDY